MSIKLPYCIVTQLSLLGILVISPTSTKAQDISPPSPHDHNGYSPSMATLFIVIIGLFFTVAFVSVYLKHFAWCLGLDLGRGPGQGGGAWNRDTAHGLDPLLVESFPTFVYSDVKRHRIGKGSLECAVCLSQFLDNEVLRLLPGCSHVFHPHCIRPWLASHVTCPLCRENLEFHQVGSIDTLATHLQRQLSDNEAEPSDHQHQSQTPPHDHILKSPEIINAIKSPLQQIKDGLARIEKLPRSHSTGHSFIEDCERFTLRLPDEVRNKLVNPIFSPLPAAMISPRTGFRTRSSGLEIKPDRWRFSVSPPFFNRTGPVLSPRFDGVVDASDSNGGSSGFISGSRNLLKSIKSPLNRMVRSSDIGERSSDRLWPDRKAHDLDVESQK